MLMTRWSVLITIKAVAMMLLVLEAGAGCAARSETGASQQEVEDLKHNIARLNARVEQLEEQGSAPAASSPPTVAVAPPAAAAPVPEERPAALRQQWRNVTYGMTFEEVDKLLGDPQRTIHESPKTVWYYSYPDIGSGSVVFTQDSGVTDWQAPPFGNWAFWP
jgi:outer membrane murein-binding lipoprotein Lpp